MTPREFEKLTGLNGNECATLLRVSHSKWYEWRDGQRTVPPYIVASMEAHAALFRAGMLAPVLARRQAEKRKA
jgi:putative SOS response-associated peptidase YedK